jgi:GNAT superfamily N-acetyltransferase
MKPAEDRPMGTKQIELRALGPADKGDFIAVLADAFALDPSFGYFFGEAGRDLAAPHFLSFMFDIARIKGDELLGAFSDGRLAACSIVERPIRPGIASALAFSRIAARAIALAAHLPRGSFARLQRYMAVARGSLPPGKWRYLVMLGVSAASRGKGLGAALLDTAIAEAEADTLCAGLALDTENEHNLPLYEGRGFKLLASHSLKGTSVFSMARPRARSGA